MIRLRMSRTRSRPILRLNRATAVYLAAPGEGTLTAFLRASARALRDMHTGRARPCARVPSVRTAVPSANQGPSASRDELATIRLRHTS
jgi:hypothetical protein